MSMSSRIVRLGASLHRIAFMGVFSSVALGCATAGPGGSGAPEVAVKESGIQVRFRGHPVVEATVAMKGGMVQGITRIMVDGQDVLAPGTDSARPPTLRHITGGHVAPVTNLDAYLAERATIGDHYKFPKRGGLQLAETPLQAHLTGWKRDGKAVVIEASTPGGHAEWRIERTTTRTYAGAYAGVNWRLLLYNSGSVYEIEVEEPVVVSEGDWRLQQRGNQSDDKCEEEFKVSLQSDTNPPYSMSKRKYNARQQPFFFLAGMRGSTLSYFDRVSCAEVGEVQKGDRVFLRSAIPVRPDSRGCAATPVKSWVFRSAGLSDKWSAVNEWTWAWDKVVGDLQSQMGVKPTDPLPILFHQEFDTPGLECGITPALRKTMAPPALNDSWLRRFADDVVPKAAEWGMGAIELRAVLDVDIDHADTECPAGSFATESVCSPWGLRISPKLGGEAGLAYVVQQAHARGIKVSIWSAPSHQSVCSPVVRAHPDWMMVDADGRVNNRGYVTLVGMDLGAGFGEYLTGAYRQLRKRTKLDGVWADSSCAFGADRNMSAKAPYPQLDEVIALQRAMQRMGYNFLTKEDCGPFGLSSRSSGLAGALGHEYLRYYFQYTPEDPTKRMDPDAYFRTLASKGMMDIRVARDFEALPAESRTRIIRGNFAYREVLPLMKRRLVLGNGDTWQGVAWSDARNRPRVLFSFVSFDWPTRKGTQGRELMNGTPFSAHEGVLHAQPWQVYLLD